MATMLLSLRWLAIPILAGGFIHSFAQAQCTIAPARDGSPFRTPLQFITTQDYQQAIAGFRQKFPPLASAEDFFSKPSSKPYPQNRNDILFADRLEGQWQNFSQASGNVVLWSDSRRISTATLLRQTHEGQDQILLNQPTRLEGDTHSIEIERGSLSVNDHAIVGKNGEFISKRATINRYQNLRNPSLETDEEPFRGVFEALSTPSPNKRQFDSALITTCPLTDRDWELSAESILADENTGVGEMRHAVLRLYGFPVFYWPWMDFPLNGQRKSGFLMPRLERLLDQNQQANEIALPYYVNLAPNYDWLFTSIINTSRGVRFDNRLRYLTADTQGQLWINGSPHDRTPVIERTKRYRLAWQNSWQINNTLNAQVLWNRVSDWRYLQDYAHDPLYSRTTIHLPLEIKISDQWKNWRWNLSYLDYQTLSTNPQADKPYVRAPYINIESPEYTPDVRDSHLYGTGVVSAEHSQFRHTQLPDINRTFVYPRWRWRTDALWGFASAQVGWHLSRYTVLDSLAQATIASQSRKVPISKASMGLIFERALSDESGNQPNASGWKQTLEPSLYWLYIPHHEQSKIPVIDTSRLSFTLGQNDLDNNFSGWDRIADTHQITLSLANRFYDGQARERFNLELGQQLYLKDQRVSLPGESVKKSGRSDLMLKASARFDDWKFEGSRRYDALLKKTSANEALFAYQPSARQLIGMRYNFALQPTLSANAIVDSSVVASVNLRKTVEGVIDWPLSSQWTISGRNYYSIEDKLYLESHLGLRYQSCCLAITLYRTNELIGANRNYRTQWGVQFSLMGLTQFGNQSDELLNKAFQSFRVR